MALTWRKASYAAQTYQAQQGDRSFVADHDGRSWRLRGWTDEEFTDYVSDLPTLRAAKEAAEGRLNG